MRNQNELHEKGFNMYQNSIPVAYNNIRVGVKNLDDAIISLGSLKKTDKVKANKGLILKALQDKDYKTLRELSNYFYNLNGIYKRICDYFANLYRYDWYVAPEIFDIAMEEQSEDKMSDDGTLQDQDKIIKDFVKVLKFLDNTHIKKLCGDIALQVVKNGAYYGYVVKTKNSYIVQELPVNYCRSRYFVGTVPAVEFNMRFFDDAFPDIQYRMRVLKLFPEEFQKGYALYRKNKLQPDYQGDTSGSWYLLDPTWTCKFSFHNSDLPVFINAAPAILDLDAAQDLDRRKQMQKLLKVIVQQLPLDKNGDLIFDIDEARDIHNNAVEMLRRAVGVDVLTTFADIKSIDLSDKNTATTTDDLERVERTVYNSFGISRNLFNTDGNMSLEKSILNDESTVRDLVIQFETFFDNLAQRLSSNKRRCNFRFFMLETTQYNYKDLTKLYKEQVQLGFGKIIPQIALGHSQSSILNTVFFENRVLNLTQVMIPPLMSSTMSSEDILGGKGQTQTAQNQNTSERKTGRPEKADDQKSEKTIQNIESMS